MSREADYCAEDFDTTGRTLTRALRSWWSPWCRRPTVVELQPAELQVVEPRVDHLGHLCPAP
jgi:hypothetical protein